MATVNDLLRRAEYPLPTFEPAENAIRYLGSSSEEGLPRQLGQARREEEGPNAIPPPHDFPEWLCCILPCILATPEMEMYHDSIPEGAEVRYGKMWIPTDATSLTRGDIIRLAEGDRVPADARLITANEFCCDQSVLVGSKAASERQLINARPGDLIFCGTLVTKGSADCVVVSTGKNTLIGRLILKKAWPLPPSEV